MIDSFFKENLLTWAEHYTRYGLRLIPLPYGQKRPAMEAWPMRASNDYEIVASWLTDGYWQKNGDGGKLLEVGGLGIATGGGVIVLDVDGEEGFKTLSILEKRYEKLPDTPMQLTPGGGAHYIFKYDGPCKNRAGLMSQKGLIGLDVRGDGGQIVAAPSIHPNGNTYRWAKGHDLDDLAIAECPIWLIKIIENDQSPEHKPSSMDKGEQISAGMRNQTLTSLAGSMRKRGMTEDAITAALLADNRARCNPPLEDEEIRSIARSIGGKPAGSDNTVHDAVNRTTLLTLRKTLDPSLDVPSVEMIAGMFPRGRLSAIIAAPGCGKTWFLQRVVSDLSVGGPVFDGFANSAPAKSLIFAGEGGLDLMVQRAANIKWAISPKNVIVYSGADAAKAAITFDVDTPAGCANLVIAIKEDLPQVVIIDTLSFFHSCEENSADKMKPIFRFLMNIASEMNIAVVVSHHTRKRKLVESKMLMNQDEASGSSIFNRFCAVIIGIENIAASDENGDSWNARPLRNLVRVQKSWYKNPSPFIYEIKEDSYGKDVMLVDLAPKIGGDHRSRIVEYIEQTYSPEEWFTSKSISDSVCVSERTTRRHLSDLVARRILKKRGGDKNAEFSIARTWQQEWEDKQDGKIIPYNQKFSDQ